MTVVRAIWGLGSSLLFVLISCAGGNGDESSEEPDAASSVPATEGAATEGAAMEGAATEGAAMEGAATDPEQPNAPVAPVGNDASAMSGGSEVSEEDESAARDAGAKGSSEPNEGDGGSTTGSAPSTPPADEPSPRDGGPPEVGATDNRFGDLVSMYSSALYDPVDGVSGAVAPSTSIVVGVVEDLVEGRKEDLSEGTNPEYYVQYQNIAIRADEVLRGFPGVSVGDRVFVEFSWPGNLDTGELSEALPRGARVIALGEIPDGVEAADAVVHVPPYGLIFETSTGSTQLPFDGGGEFHEAIENYEGDGTSFDDLVAAVADAAQ